METLLEVSVALGLNRSFMKVLGISFLDPDKLNSPMPCFRDLLLNLAINCFPNSIFKAQFQVLTYILIKPPQTFSLK